MFFKVNEVFDYKLDRYVYSIYREEHLLHKVFHKGLEDFVLDRSCLHDTDMIQYSWSSYVMTGSEARELIKKMFEPTIINAAIW